MKCNAFTAERIGATWLRRTLAPVSDFGRRAEDAAQPFGPHDEAAVRTRCAQIVELADRLDVAGPARIRAALRGAPDPVDIISRATVGEPLADVDFFELGRFIDALDATASAWDAAGGPGSDRPPVLPQIADLLARGRTGAAFYLADRFSPALAAARAAAAAADAAVTRERERLGRAVAAELGGIPDAEEFILMRDAVPRVPPGVRIVRETPAYRLVALELDADALAAVGRHDAAHDVVARHEDAVRRDLATAIAAEGSAVLAAAHQLGELDRTLARVAFTQVWGGCVPQLTSAEFSFVEASLVPLRDALAAAGLPYTPITLDLPGVAVLTGPNMGGKSAALATCGFLAACVACGVPPPARAATLPLVESIAWIGGEEAADRARLLSAFGGEVVRMRDALAGAAPPTLLLIDEFARTTGPREGRALLVALVEALAKRAIFALVATHFDGIAGAAGVAHYAIAGLGENALDVLVGDDIGAALAVVARAMDYRILAVNGTTDSTSDALAVARILGFEPAIIARAAELFAADDLGRTGSPDSRKTARWNR